MGYKKYREEWAELYRNGEGTSAIAQQYGCAASTVYSHLKKHGVKIRGYNRSDIERFNRFVEEGDGDCLVWQGHRNCKGYGGFAVDSVSVRAHRWIYEHVTGHDPTGLFVLHRCDNPPCVNVSHLYAGTPKQNMVDRDKRGRTLRGEEHGSSVLSRENVIAIRRASKEGVSNKALAEKFGVAQSTVSSVVTRENWAHI